MRRQKVIVKRLETGKKVRVKEESRRERDS